LHIGKTVNGRWMWGKTGQYLFRIMWIMAVLFTVVVKHESHASELQVTIGISEFEPLYCISDQVIDSGMIVTVLRKIATEENWHIRLVPGTREKTLERLESGEVDIAAMIPYKRQPDRRFDFNQETLLSTWAQIYCGETLEIQSFLDLAGRSIGVIREDEYARAIRNTVAGLNISCRIVEFNHPVEIFQAIQKGWIDAGVVDRFQGHLNAKMDGVKQTSIIFSPIELRLASLKNQNRNLLDAIDYGLKKQKNAPDSVYHRELGKIIGGLDDSAAYRRLMVWLIACSGFLIFTGMAAVLLRYQVRKKTAELLQNQQVLKDEIIARRSAEERYKSIFENTGTATVLIEEDMTLSMINENAAKLLGYPREQIEGKMKTGDFITGEVFQMVSRFHRDRRRGDPNVPTEYEAQLINRNGDKKEIFFRVGMLPETRTSIASLIDITDKKQMEHQLRQAHKLQAIGALAGGIAHDFNNVLTGIMGYAEMALKDPENPSLLTKRIGHILTAGARARELIRQILTFSRQNEHRVEPVIMNHILEETLRLIQATVPGTITIKTRNDAPAGMIMADPTQIHQVILNLCTNAIQSMGNNRGELMASLNTVVLNGAAVRFQPPLKPGKYVQLTIRDTGQGMSPDIVDRIFDPFFTTKKPGDGTGMGLSVVHGIVKSLQGSIAVHSEYGKGSIFDVYIPAADSHIGQPGVSHRIDAVAVEPKMLSGQCEH